MATSNVYPINGAAPGQSQARQAPPVAAWTPMLDNADPSIRSRWLWFSLLVGLAAFIGAHAIEMITSGEPRALVEIGLGRIMQAAREWPTLRPLVSIVVGVEHLLAAGVLVWLSVIVLRKVPVARPSSSELLVVATRQLPHFRIVLALTGLIELGLGFALATWADAARAATAAYVPMAGHVPAGIFIIAAGLVEFHGLQRLARAAISATVPALRISLVLIADPLNAGMTNRLCLGDGWFARTGQRVIYHEDVVEVRHRISAFRGRVLGLSDLVLTFDDRGSPATVTIEAPASIAQTQRIVDTMSGIWRAAQPRIRTSAVSYVMPRR